MMKMIMSAIGFLSNQLIIILVGLLVAILISSVLIRYTRRKRYRSQMELLEAIYEDLRAKLYSQEFTQLKRKTQEDKTFASLAETMELMELHKRLESKLASGYELILDYNDQKSVDIKTTATLVSYMYGFYDDLEEDIEAYTEKLSGMFGVVDIEDEEDEAIIEEVKPAYAGFTSHEQQDVYASKVIEEEKDMVDNNRYFEEFDEEDEEIEVIPRRGEVNQAVDVTPNTEYSVFAKGLVINGDVSLTSPLVVHGEVNGNIISNSEIKLEEHSSVVGDVRSSSTHMEHSSVEGNIISSNDVYVGPDSKISGNVHGDNLHVSGWINGDVNASGEVKFMRSAQVVGNIRASFIDIEKGARVKGTFTIGEAQEDEQ